MVEAMELENCSWKKLKCFGEIEQYMYDIPKFAKKNHMDDTKTFLQFLVERSGYTLQNLDGKVIHVAGTNGKGSVCAYMDSVLREAGYKTGLFTSPHLVTMRERFKISGEMMKEEEFIRLFFHVMKYAEAFGEAKKEDYHPTFFELLFFMAVVFFLEKQTDYMIIETGLGGRLDTTNCILHPIVSIITEIGLDHTEYLGETIAQIAGEKAGIIKPGTPLVYWGAKEEAASVIARHAAQSGVMAVCVKPEDIHELKFHKKYIDFSLESRYYNNIKITLANSAIYQTENATLAFRALELIGQGRITQQQLQSGFKNARWEGRMEEILPGVYLDGAHNIDGIKAFLTTVKADDCQGKRVLLFGVMKDKFYHRMIKLLTESNLFDKIVLTHVDSERTLEEEQLKSAFMESTDIEVVYFANAAEAFYNAIENKQTEDRIYISGSLYLVGEMKALLRRNLDD